MKKNLLSIIAIILSVVAIIISFITYAKVNIMKPVVTTNEESEIPSQQNTQEPIVINEQYRNASVLSYFTDLEIYHGSIYGDYCTLSSYSGEETVTFTYGDGVHGSEMCEFSKDVFDDLLDLICSTELNELPLPTDENGKLIEKRVSDCIAISNGGAYHYFAEIENKEEIINYFIRLREAAMK